MKIQILFACIIAAALSGCASNARTHIVHDITIDQKADGSYDTNEVPLAALGLHQNRVEQLKAVQPMQQAPPPQIIIVNSADEQSQPASQTVMDQQAYRKRYTKTSAGEAIKVRFIKRDGSSSILEEIATGIRFKKMGNFGDEGDEFSVYPDPPRNKRIYQ